MIIATLVCILAQILLYFVLKDGEFCKKILLYLMTFIFFSSIVLGMFLLLPRKVIYFDHRISGDSKNIFHCWVPNLGAPINHEKGQIRFSNQLLISIQTIWFQMRPEIIFSTWSGQSLLLRIYNQLLDKMINQLKIVWSTRLWDYLQFNNPGSICNMRNKWHFCQCY